MKNMPKMASAIALGFFIGLGYLSNVNAFSGSNVSEDEMGAQALANNPNLDPNFFVGNNFDYYPMLLNNVAGYDSLLVVTNMLIRLDFMMSALYRLVPLPGNAHKILDLPDEILIFFMLVEGPLDS